MCQVLDVSKSGYYRWLKTKDNIEEEKENLNETIKLIFEQSRGTYGSPRVFIALQKMNINVSESTVARRMKELRLTPIIKKKFKHTTDSKHDFKISPNILDRDFTATELGQVWVSDITYIRVRHSFVYLTTVVDLADRMVVGWSVSKDMTAKNTVIAAFKKAIENRPTVSGFIFHSDRGSQYACNSFREILGKQDTIQSMSRKGNCWDNAVAESFFKTIKVECIYKLKLENIEQAYTAIFDYIDGWYNTLRIHSSLDGRSPREMAHFLQKKEVA